ncbi:MAG: HDOD domain-containing protein [Chromatiales bacterium]|nr:HDOD domain-containing protein [Chromatiales bacterium]
MSKVFNVSPYGNGASFHIVKIFDVATLGNAMHIVMEYVSGGDLQARLGEALPVPRALEILIRIGSALGAVHAKGIVHRDVKPANILFRSDGTPLLSDFGIAKELDVDASLTQSGAILGSPYYMCPEQVEGVRVDARADIYSLGAVFHEMLTGDRPYDGNSAFDVVTQHVRAPIPRLPDAVGLVQPVLDRMMAKNRNDRFASACELVDAVKQLAAEVNAGVDLAGRTRVGLGAMRPVSRTGRHLGQEVVDSFRSGILEDLKNDRLVLPSLPDVALKIRQELERPEASAATIAKTLAMDPAVSAQVLRVANSALYLGRSPVADLQTAVVRLGANVVHQVVMMLAVSQLLDAKTRPALDSHLEPLWRHSVHVATLCDVIARKIRTVDRNVAMLAGLIHDIGTLPILVWAEPIPGVMGDERTLADIIEALHCELGRQMLEHWNYPAALIAVLGGHEDVARSVGGPADLVDIVQVANHLAWTGTDSPKANVDWTRLPAAERLGLTEEDGPALLEAAEPARKELSAALGR